MLLESLELGRPYLPRPSTAQIVEDCFTRTQYSQTTLGDLKAFPATVGAIRGALHVSALLQHGDRLRGLRRLEEEAAWIERYRQLWEARFDELDKIVEELTRKEKIDGKRNKRE